MENVLTNEIRGFISPKGILIKIANIDFGEDPVETVAESILRDVEKCTALALEIRNLSKSFNLSMNRIFRQYLIEKYGYVYIHIKYLDESVDVEEIVSPSNLERVNELQRKRISILCKEKQEQDVIPKILEKKRGKDNGKSN